jgi:hypothetical protein
MPNLEIHSFLKFLLFIYTYNVWVISPPFPPLPPLLFPPPHPLPPTPLLPGRNYFALISNFVVERVLSNNRKEQGFLLVEIRIAI